jgi:hypothetical protein
MCHYDQLTVPLPEVIVVVLNPPAGPDVEPETPLSEIVLESGYLRITMPEPPLPPFAEPPE